MDKKTKIAAIATGILLAGVIVTPIALKHLDGLSWTDKYGFTHNAEIESNSTVDENASRIYALVEIDDKYESLSGHDFIDKISTILSAYSDKVYTTFLFSDGTGLYFPDSDINQIAIYGVANEKGEITDPQKYVYISGTQITLEDVSSMYSQTSQDLLNLCPDEYMYDSFFAAAEDKNAYFTLFETDDLTASLTELHRYATQVGCDTSYFIVIDSDGYEHGYIASSAGITNDDSAIETVNVYLEEQN